jgi:hypothetical protein
VKLRGDEAGLLFHERGIRRPGLEQLVGLLGLYREGVDQDHRADLLLHLLKERHMPIHLDQLRHLLPPPWWLAPSIREHDATGGSPAHLGKVYSPKCPEGVFSEVRGRLASQQSG